MIKVQSTYFPNQSDMIATAKERLGRNITYSAILNYWELNGRFNESLFKRIISIKNQKDIDLIN